MASTISFNTTGIKFVLKNKALIKNWISETIKSEGGRPGEINFIFCDDNYLLEINKQYLQHDTLTDIISFDYSEEEKKSGDIFISIERVEENAINYKVPFQEELNRVIIHGILHLCGFKDKKKADKAIMTAAEDKYLHALTSIK
jgi:probable rRNA maturation factor